MLRGKLPTTEIILLETGGYNYFSDDMNQKHEALLDLQ